MLAGDGLFTKKCQNWIEKNLEVNQALLTHSCTAALEMAALLINIKPGDEIIMPSYTFVSTANAFVLRGGTPVFVDIRPDTLNIDESLIEAAITYRTKAIVPIHYAGVACAMDEIMSISTRHDIKVIEDAAQGVMSKYKGLSLGGIGHIGAYSFHETKNVISGEGGALCVNDRALALQAEIIREKGTDRSRYFRGEVDKYTWQSIGSSFLPGEITAAFLFAQLEEAKEITNKRLAIWEEYDSRLASLELKGALKRPTIPAGCEHNGHMYYVVLAPEIDRDFVLKELSKKGVHAVFHYVPLHSSPAGLLYSKTHGSMSVTNEKSSRLIRLPLWVGLSPEKQAYIVDLLEGIIG